MNKSKPGSPAVLLCGLLWAATSMLACEVGYKDIGDDPTGDGDGDGDDDPIGDGDGDPMADGDGDGDGDDDPIGDGDGDGDTGDDDPIGDGDGDPMTDPCVGMFDTCGELQAAFVAETEAIRTCSEAADCGQPLAGTSCGCTNDWVARTDADPACFYGMIEQGSLMECDLGLDSDCGCPEADGFDCVQGICEWNYL